MKFMDNMMNPTKKELEEGNQERLFEAIKSMLLSNGAEVEVGIYLNNTAYTWGIGYYDQEPLKTKGVKASDKFIWANDKGLSIVFGGESVLYDEEHAVTSEILDLIERYGYDFATGSEGNLTTYPKK